MGASVPLARALAAAATTQFLEIDCGALRAVPAVFNAAFPKQNVAALIADRNTFAAAGEVVQGLLKAAGIDVRTHVITDPALNAEWKYVEELDGVIASNGEATPVVVGSGVLNDLVKLAAYRASRQYLCVATAASMDGYTAYASSITCKGSKQMFDGPAPRAVVADLNVIAQAPPLMNAAGYADVVAKIPAGADWILADALGVEAVDTTSWDLVQPHLRGWCDNATGIPTGDATAIRGLTEGLMMTGFAMQSHKTSRPASGAEHQFSHLWDMEHHTHNGATVPHGFKVGIGSLAITGLYEWLFAQDLTKLDIDALANRWPATADDAAKQARPFFAIAALADKAEMETRAKYIPRDVLRAQLQSLKDKWPTLKQQLREQLIPRAQLRQMLKDAGAPTESEQIGIPADRLRQSHWQAYYIRRRFTVLDMAVRTGLLETYAAKN